MKLYATVASERASKGQGGNKYIDINLFTGSASESKLFASIRLNAPDGVNTLWVDGKVVKQDKAEQQKGECTHNDGKPRALCPVCMPSVS